MAKGVLTGEITKKAFRREMKVAIEGLLNDVGKVGVELIKGETHKSRSSGRLEDSIMYVTARGGSRMGSGAKTTDAIEKPTDKDTVIIGSNVPYAIHIEDGTPKHEKSAGHDEFVADLKDWYAREFGIYPDATPETRFHFWNIYEKIATQGTKAQPFIMPVEEKVYAFARRRLGEAMAKMARSTR